MHLSHGILRHWLPCAFLLVALAALAAGLPVCPLARKVWPVVFLHPVSGLAPAALPGVPLAEQAAGLLVQVLPTSAWYMPWAAAVQSRDGAGKPAARTGLAVQVAAVPAPVREP